MSVFKRLLSALGLSERIPRGKPGTRLYAVGDIHGRLDLARAILAVIAKDIASRPPRPNVLVFLGDLIDRGPDSAGVIELLRTTSLPNTRTMFLLGNHEEVLLEVLKGKPGLLYDWVKFGGAECLASYGVDPEKVGGMDEAAAAALLRQHIPAEHVAFLESFGDTVRFGDYLLVHAGIRPGVELEKQAPHDLRWIREPFLKDVQDHGFVVVHGHTITDQVEEKPNRIGLDTGAYRTGRLTALVIEDTERRYLATA